jgi:hypothetical protein
MKGKSLILKLFRKFENISSHIHFSPQNRAFYEVVKKNTRPATNERTHKATAQFNVKVQARSPELHRFQSFSPHIFRQKQSTATETVVISI